MAVNIVADLLGFVAEHRIGAARDRHLHEVRKKAVKLDARVRRSGQTAPTENANFHTEVAAIFLSHEVRRGFGSSKERMKGLVNPAVLTDALVVLGPGVVPALFELLER